MSVRFACPCWCVWVGCHRPQNDVMGSNHIDSEAVLNITHKPSPHQASPTKRPFPNLVLRLPKRWLICYNLLMLSPQLQTHTLTQDDGAYRRSCWDSPVAFSPWSVLQIWFSSTKRLLINIRACWVKSGQHVIATKAADSWLSNVSVSASFTYSYATYA